MADTKRRSNIAPRRNERVSSRGVHFVYYLVAGLLFLNLLALYGVFFFPKGIMGYRQKREQVEELQERNEKLRLKNHNLFLKIEKAKNDPRGQERLVREHLGWVKENEIVIHFLPQKKENP